MNCLRAHSLDNDDAFSNFSRISYGFQNSLNSIYNSDSECSGPISVRDMIQHYNNQVKRNGMNTVNHKNTYKVNTAKKYHHSSQHLLSSTKSSYCGLNNFGSNTNCCNRLEADNYNHTANTCCKKCTACSSCRNGSRKNSSTTKILSSTASSSSSLLMLQPNENNDEKANNNFSMQNSRSSSCTRSFNTNCNKINAKDTTHTSILAVENCSNIKDETVNATGADISVDTTTSVHNNTSNLLNDDFCTELSLDCGNGLFMNDNSQVVAEQKKNHLLSSDSAKEGRICQQQQLPSADTTYQSKTTIAKTSSGVRIIVDIFFDQERCANASDIVGSRVETDIPQSRILDEFQQQTMPAKIEAAPYFHQDRL